MSTAFFVICPLIPDIELIKINTEAVVTICFGFAALNKNKIGLKNIPPPIPTTPDMNPKIPPINIDIAKGMFL